MKNLKNRKTIILVASFVIVALISFCIGSKYSKSKNIENIQNMQGGKFSQQMGMRGNGFGGGMINGEILAKDNTSITLKLRDGGSKIVFYTDKTTIAKTVDGILDDLAVGKQVNVIGTTNPDGSVSAQSVQIRTVSIPVPAQ